VSGWRGGALRSSQDVGKAMAGIRRGGIRTAAAVTAGSDGSEPGSDDPKMRSNREGFPAGCRFRHPEGVMQHNLRDRPGFEGGTLTELRSVMMLFRRCGGARDRPGSSGDGGSVVCLVQEPFNSVVRDGKVARSGSLKYLAGRRSATPQAEGGETNQRRTAPFWWESAAR